MKREQSKSASKPSKKNDAKQSDTALLFISHRHQDKLIADKVRKWLEQWTARRVEVFQSSSYAHGGKIGKSLSQTLLTNLYLADVLVLIYTIVDQDWSWSMWECGVATDPRSPKTRVVVLQFSEDVPAPFEDQLRVNVRSEESVKQFANQLLTDSDFFPGTRGAITGYQAESSQVIAAGKALFDTLQKIPATRHEKVDEWPAWPFLRLQMSLDTAKCVAAGDFTSKRKQILLQSEIVYADSTLLSLFGVPKIGSLTTLQTLYARWKKQSSSLDTSWIDSIASQIHMASQWEFPRLDWKLFQGQRSKANEWFSPVVTWVRKIPYRNVMEFEVYFLPFVADAKEGLIQLPLPQRARVVTPRRRRR